MDNVLTIMYSRIVCSKARSTIMDAKDIVCRSCKKEFFVLNRDGYTYKIKHKSNKAIYFCSYTCWIKYKRYIESKQRGGFKNVKEL